jgi:deaminated glutathione amidase
MADTLRVAAVQMHSSDIKSDNIEQALELIERAASYGATLVALPEVWTYLGDTAGIASITDDIPGPLTERLADAARRHGIYLHCGSIYERVAGEPRAHNTTVVLGPDGDIIGRYRKIHLFDVSIGDSVAFTESEMIAPGDETVVIDLGGVKLGLSICYDLRFTELFRMLALDGAEIIALPAAFTQFTGKDHWEVLLRARAIENQVFMLAPNEHGRHPGGSVTYGRSMIVDPWGTVLATAADGPGVAIADCDLNALARIRREVPSLANRQPGAYRERWASEAAAVG